MLMQPTQHMDTVTCSEAPQASSKMHISEQFFSVIVDTGVPLTEFLTSGQPYRVQCDNNKLKMSQPRLL